MIPHPDPDDSGPPDTDENNDSATNQRDKSYLGGLLEQVEDRVLHPTTEETPSDPSTDDHQGQSGAREGTHSSFQELLDRLGGEGSDREERPHRSPANPEGQPTKSAGVDPLDRVRDLIPEGVRPPPVQSRHETTHTDSSRHRKLYAGIIIGVVIALVIPGIVFATEMTLREELFESGPSTYVGEDDVLYLGADDAAYMSRVFRESTHEVAYCGVVSEEDGRSLLKVSLADTVSSSPESVSFSTENCPDAGRQVLLHTHPNGDTRLSQQDRETIATRPEAIVCVQGGPITVGPGQETDNLGCYLQLNSGTEDLQLERIRVIVA